MNSKRLWRAFKLFCFFMIIPAWCLLIFGGATAAEHYVGKWAGNAVVIFGILLSFFFLCYFLTSDERS